MPKNSETPPVLAGYVPVLHRGYVQWFNAYPNAELHVFGPDLLAEEDYLRKELRAVEPQVMADTLRKSGLVQAASVATIQTLQELNEAGGAVILPDEDVSRTVAGKYLKNAEVSYYPVFLRWDRKNVEGVDAVDTDLRVSTDELDKQFMKAALAQAERSPDIWRQVGAVLVKDTKVQSVAVNRPMTTDATPWAEGDPRGIFKRGVGIEMSTFAHAEAQLIARAAREGTSLEGALLYVSTYPCPPCAALVAGSGIKTLYYADGYAVLDGRRVLDEHGVELIKVDLNYEEKPTGNHEVWVPYPEK